MTFPPTVLPEGTDREVTPKDVVDRWGKRVWRNRTDKHCIKASGKVKYLTEKRAINCAIELEHRFGSEPQRAFPCEYSRGRLPHWHLTRAGEWDQSGVRPYRVYLPTGDTSIIYGGPPAPFPWPEDRKVLK